MKNNLLKKYASHLKSDSHSKRQNKNIERKERKTKNEKKSNSNNKYFFTFSLLFRKSYMLSENIFERT